MNSSHWRLPPLELLLAFEASARHLSFTKAAGELFQILLKPYPIEALQQAIGEAVSKVSGGRPA